MSPSAIAEYLGQVAPVPFSPAFKFGAELTATLKRQVDLGVLDIRVDGAEEPIYRPHRDGFSFEDKQAISFDTVSVIDIPGIDGDVAAIAWVLHHKYEGAVPTGTLVKGLRLRSGNIQVGDHTLLEELFPKPRFNLWSVGEVHVIDRGVVPNGRRDHFEQNAHFHNLVNHLAPTARDIARRCRTSSIKRKWLREFELHREAAAHKLDIAAQESLEETDRQNLLSSLRPTLAHLDKIAGMPLLADEHASTMVTDTAELRTRAEQLAGKSNGDASPLAHMPGEKRAMYEHLFGLIYECAANRVAAKALIDRILARLRSTPESA